MSLLECVNCSNSTAQLIHTVRAPSLHPPAPRRVGHIHLLHDGKGTKAAASLFLFLFLFCYIPAAYTFTVALFSPSELFSWQTLIHPARRTRLQSTSTRCQRSHASSHIDKNDMWNLLKNVLAWKEPLTGRRVDCELLLETSLRKTRSSHQITCESFCNHFTRLHIRF